MKITDNWLCLDNMIGFYDPQTLKFQCADYCISRRRYYERTPVIVGLASINEDIYSNSYYTLDQKSYDCFTSQRLRKWWFESLKQSVFNDFVDKDIDYRVPKATLNGPSYAWEIIQTTLIRLLWEYPKLVYATWWYKNKLKVPFECAFIVAHYYGNYLGRGHTFMPYLSNIADIYPKMMQKEVWIRALMSSNTANTVFSNEYSKDVNINKIEELLHYIGFQDSFVEVTPHVFWRFA